jgi:hypothetical protein
VAAPSVAPHSGHSNTGASAAQFSALNTPSPRIAPSLPVSVKRTNIRPAVGTRTVTSEAGTTARGVGTRFVLCCHST